MRDFDAGAVVLNVVIIVAVVVVVKAMAMAAVGWTVSALMSLPQLGIYSVNVVANKTVCESIFRQRPMSHRQAYLTFINLIVFFIPSIIMFVCYCRIFTKISSKADRTASVLSTDDPQSDSIALTSTSVRKILARFESHWNSVSVSSPVVCCVISRIVVFNQLLTVIFLQFIA